MSRVARPKGSERTSRSASESSVGGKYVCPFCGSVNERPDEPCPRCTMENTPVTRQATKARIGPWYVWQSRNPAAPGMKWQTLMTLVRKGQVSGRSVVRGPTTHQLWRFAARVKGLSREFGVCYACGLEIEKTSRSCPHCSRLQEPPADPDVLVENEPHKPVFRAINEEKGAEGVIGGAPPSPFADAPVARAAAERDLEPPAVEPAPTENRSPRPAAPKPEPSPAPAAESVLIEGEEETELPTDVMEGSEVARDDVSDAAAPSPVTDAAPEVKPEPAPVAPKVNGEAQKRPAAPLPRREDPPEQTEPESSPVEPPPAREPIPGRQRAPDGILSPQELAAAFRLQYDRSPLLRPRPKKSAGAGRVLVGLLLVALLAIGGLLYLTPSARSASVNWAKHTFSSLSGTPDKPNRPPTPDPSPLPTIQRIPTPAAPESVVHDPIVKPTRPAAPQAPAKDEARPAPPQVHTPLAPPTVTARQTARIEGPPPPTIRTEAPPAPKPPQAEAKPAPPAPVVSPADVDDQVRRMWANALDAESRGNYSDAIYWYQQIKKLPKDSWPGGLDIRLDLDRKHLDKHADDGQ